MGVHAFLSPSFGHIGYHCPASAIRSFQVNQRAQLLREVAAEFYGLKERTDIERLDLVLAEDNKMATEGTAFHEVFEEVVPLSKLTNVIIMKKIQGREDISDYTKKDDYVIQGFMRACREERKFIRSMEWSGLEHRVKVKGLAQFGTMDVVCFKDTTLYIRDLKTGRNEVSAEENEQLMTYAIGILDELGWDKFDKVELSVIGVRFASNSWMTTPKALKKFKLEVMLPAFMEAYSINPRAIPGDHCNFCAGKINCEAWQKKFNGVANETFDSLDVADLDNDGLVSLYRLCKQAENLAKYQLGPEILMQFEGFDAPKNITRVTGARKDIWNVPAEEVEAIMKSKVDDTKLLYNESLKTPKQMTTVFGKIKGYDKLVKKTQNKPHLRV